MKRQRWKNWAFLVSVREMLRIILKENSFQLNEKYYTVKNHGTAMSTYSSFLSNIFMAAYIETQSLSKTVFKPTVWKCYIDDIFSLWDISKPDMVDFFKFTDQVNLLHPTALLAIKINGRNIWHWDNLFRPGCIPRHNIQRKMRKSYPWHKDEF